MRKRAKCDKVKSNEILDLNNQGDVISVEGQYIEKWC